MALLYASAKRHTVVQGVPCSLSFGASSLLAITAAALVLWHSAAAEETQASSRYEPYNASFFGRRRLLNKITYSLIDYLLIYLRPYLLN